MKHSTPNTQHSFWTAAATAQKDGVALIICLGLLAVMTLMAVTFSISMRVERLAARNYADSVRAKHLVNAALVRTMKDIDAHLAPPSAAQRRVYPAWNVTNSTGTGPDANLLSPQALRIIPGGELMKEASNARPKWVASDLPRARIAYLVVNSAGLIDANSFGNAGNVPRVWSTNVQEIDIDNAGEFKTGSTMEDFVNERVDTIIRYETIDELPALSAHLEGSISNFTTFSYDPGRDKVFLNPSALPAAAWWLKIDKSRPPAALGTRDAEYFLHDKFNINSITNYACYNVVNANIDTMRTKYKTGTDSAYFLTNYFATLTNMLRDAVLTDTGQQSDRPVDVAWNIVNYLDADRVPQGDTTSDLPWTKSEGGEAIPLVNEIVIEEKVRIVGVSTTYEYYVTAELWYPHAPLDIKPADDFGAQLWVWTSTPGLLDELDITNSAYINTNFSRTISIPEMVFGMPNEFVMISNRTPIVVGPPGDSRRIDPNIPNRYFHFLVRVTQGGTTTANAFQIVDEAMGYDNTDASANRRALYKVDNVNKLGSYQVNDPRSNGQVRYWNYPTGGGNENGRMFPVSQHTLGAVNANCSAYLLKGSGLPLYAKNGPMNNIAELGHIWRSNLDDELRAGSDIRNAWWRTIDLMRKTEGSMLLDLMTTRNPRPPYTGVFGANSKQKDAWRIMFNNLRIGSDNIANTPAVAVDPAAREAVIRELVKTNFVSFTDLFTDAYSDAGGGGPLADAFRACAPGDDPNDIYKEDTFRHLCEMLTFRQNIFTIILAAQVMSEEGSVPIAERRAVATVYRDAYTGRRFIRNFTWLDD